MRILAIRLMRGDVKSSYRSSQLLPSYETICTLRLIEVSSFAGRLDVPSATLPLCFHRDRR